MTADPVPVLACVALIAAAFVILMAGLVAAREQARPWTASERALESATGASLRDHLRRALAREKDAREDAERLGRELAEAERMIEQQELELDALMGGSHG